jgi:hypothetical protein
MMAPQQENRAKFQRQVRAFFHSQKWKNTLIFFSFVVLAFCFRVNQYFRQKFDFEIAVPVHYTRIPPGIALSGDVPGEIILKVRDKGTAWLHYSFNKADTIDINLSNILLQKSVYVVDQNALQNLIQVRLLASTQVTSFSPGKIEIDYSPLGKKELPVIIDGMLSPAPGYMFSDSIIIDPPVVTAFSDKKTLDTLHVIKTVPSDHKNLSKSNHFSIRLKAPQGVQLSNEQVKIAVNVEEYTEKKINLPVLCHNLPANRIVRFFPSFVELTVQVGLSKYSQISASDFEISIDYKELFGSSTSNYPLKLREKPEWLNHYRIVPETVEYLIEQTKE